MEREGGTVQNITQLKVGDIIMFVYVRAASRQFVLQPQAVKSYHTSTHVIQRNLIQCATSYKVSLNTI